MARSASPFKFRTIKNDAGDDYQRGIFHPDRDNETRDALISRFGKDVEFVAYVLGRGTKCRVKAAVERNGEEIAQGAWCGGKTRDAATLAAFVALSQGDAPESEATPESGDKPKKGKKNKGGKVAEAVRPESDAPESDAAEANTADDAPESAPDVPEIGFDQFARIVRGLWANATQIFAGGSASGDTDGAAHEIANLMDQTERIARMCDAPEASDVAECVVKLMGNQRAILLEITAGRIDGRRSRKLRKFVKRATDGATA
jgi:hypothetical protein